MRKSVLRFTFGMAAACALTMLTAVNAEEKRAMEDFGDLQLEFTEDVSDSTFDLSLPAPEAPKAAVQQAQPAPATAPVSAPASAPSLAPAKELNLAQTPAPPVPVEAGAVDANISNILAEPALNPPASNITDAVPNSAPAAPFKSTVTPTLPQLPPIQQSIVTPTEKAETLPPPVTIDPTMDTASPFNQPLNQSVNSAVNGNAIARGPAPATMDNGPYQQEGYGYGYGYGGGTLRPVHYGVQRNGVPGYPRAGNCCGCGGPGCPGCGGCGCGCGWPHRYPMEYPYYTLRGPRDFDDPNPRPIGP